MAAAILIVLLVGQLPHLDQGLEQRRHAISVFQPMKAKVLTDYNLVDMMVNIPLQAELMKVGWDHSILTVDLLGTQPDAAWNDMEQLVLFSFSEVQNVRQVLIRIFKNRGDDRMLLMAAETRKNEWMEKELAELRPSVFLIDPDFTSKIRLTITPTGKRWITNFAN